MYTTNTGDFKEALYQEDALRTESPQFHPEMINGQEYIDLLEQFVEIGNKIDRKKKQLFYGKVYEDAEPVPTNNRIINSDHVEVRLHHALLGITTESVELVEALLPALKGEKAIDKVNVQEELSDHVWYMSLAHKILGTSFAKLGKMVTLKLAKRYPNKFTTSAAVNRNIAEEREILESQSA